MTPETVKRIIEVLEVGGTWSMAAAAGNISDDTLKAWRDAFPGFSAACARARDGGAAMLVEKIRREAETGDWRAAAWLLERIKADEFGRRVLVGGAGGAPIQIEGELKIAGDVRAKVDATKLLHDAIGAAAAGNK